MRADLWRRMVSRCVSSDIEHCSTQRHSGRALALPPECWFSYFSGRLDSRITGKLENVDSNGSCARDSRTRGAQLC